jgi:hypothetical protein
VTGLLITPPDPRIVDVVVDANGHTLRGCAPRTGNCKLPVFEEVFASRMRDYPRSDWDDLLKDNASLETLIRWMHNQKQEGTCTANAADGGYETILNMQVGPQNGIKQSPIATYRWCASGPNSGSNVEEIVEQFQKVGSLPEDTPENRARLKAMGLPENHVLQHTGYYQKFPEGWEDTAPHFRIDEAYRVASFEGGVSAMFDDFIVHYGRAGHSIFGVCPAKSGSVYYWKYGNSWDTHPQGGWGEVGQNGIRMFGYDSESFLRNAIASYGAVAYRSVVITEAFLKGMKVF